MREEHDLHLERTQILADLLDGVVPCCICTQWPLRGLGMRLLQPCWRDPQALRRNAAVPCSTHIRFTLRLMLWEGA